MAGCWDPVLQEPVVEGTEYLLSGKDPSHSSRTVLFLLQRNGSQSRPALDWCVNKVWSHSEIAAFIELICIDNDTSTKA
jgi:hypothetical protein